MSVRHSTSWRLRRSKILRETKRVLNCRNEVFRVVLDHKVEVDDIIILIVEDLGL
jgi:hypothetical protein